MQNSVEQLFHEPKKELNNLLIIKDNITYQDFINIYSQSSSIEEKINSLKSIINIFSHEKSLLNICYFCTNIKLKEIDFQLDESFEKSNFSYFLPQDNFQQWLIEKFFEEENNDIKYYLKELFAIIISVFGIDKYDLSFIYKELTKIYFYPTEENNELNINAFFAFKIIEIIWFNIIYIFHYYIIISIIFIIISNSIKTIPNR